MPKKKSGGYVNVMVLMSCCSSAVVVNENVTLDDGLPATRSNAAISNERPVTWLAVWQRTPDGADTMSSMAQIITAVKKRRRQIAARHAAQARDRAGRTSPKAAQNTANTCAVCAVKLTPGVAGSDRDAE